MSECFVKVIPFCVEYICDICGQGFMEQVGTILLSDPPQWPHKCNKCGVEINLSTKYPTIRWQEESKEQPCQE